MLPTWCLLRARGRPHNLPRPKSPPPVAVIGLIWATTLGPLPLSVRVGLVLGRGCPAWIGEVFGCAGVATCLSSFGAPRAQPAFASQVRGDPLYPGLCKGVFYNVFTNRGPWQSLSSSTRARSQTSPNIRRHWSCWDERAWPCGGLPRGCPAPALRRGFAGQPRAGRPAPPPCVLAGGEENAPGPCA